MTLVVEDMVTWEAEHIDGSVQRERDGAVYAGIERSTLRKFRLVTLDGQVLFETWPPEGHTGHQLVYRRRISMVQSEGERRVLFLIGWIPTGPAFVLDISGGSYRELPQGFDPADVEAYPPVPMPGELWFLDNQ